MFGLGDVSIVIAMFGSVVVSCICVVYGLINWNRGDDSKEGEK